MASAVSCWHEIVLAGQGDQCTDDDARQGIAEWWDQGVNAMRERFAAQPNAEWQALPTSDEVRFEELKGEDAMEEMFDMSLRYMVVAYATEHVVILWSWARRGRSVKIYGCVFPSTAMRDLRSLTVTLRNALHKQFCVGDLAVRQQLLTCASKKFPQPSERSTLGWLQDDAGKKRALRARFLATLDGRGGDGNVCYDGAKSLEWRPDEMDYYKHWVGMFCFGRGLLHGHCVEGIIELDSDSFNLLETLMLDANLSDPAHIECDYKTTFFMGLYALRCAIEARQRHFAPQPQDKDEQGVGGVVHGRAMCDSILRAVAFRFHTRVKYLFANDEKRVIGLLDSNRARCIQVENTCAGERAFLFPFLGEENGKAAALCEDLQDIRLVAEEESITLYIPLRKHALHTQMLERPTTYNMLSPEAETKTDIKIDPTTMTWNSAVCCADAFAEVWRWQRLRDMNVRAWCKQDMHGLIDSHEQQPQQSLLPDLPVRFYMRVQPVQLNVWVRSVMEVLLGGGGGGEHAEIRKSVLYCQYEDKQQMASAIQCGKWPERARIVALLPGLVLSTHRTLVAMIQAVRIAMKLHTTDEAAVKADYKPGFVLPPEGILCALHPTRSDFCDMTHLDAERTKARQVMRHYDWPFGKEELAVWSDVITRRFLRQHPMDAVPTKLFFVPAEDLSHDTLVPFEEDDGDGGDRCRCLYEMDKTIVRMQCTVCERAERVVDPSGESKTEWVVLHYREVAMWMFGRMLDTLRRLAAFLDKTAVAEHHAFATVEDFDAWMQQHRSTAIWDVVQAKIEQELGGGSGGSRGGGGKDNGAANRTAQEDHPVDDSLLESDAAEMQWVAAAVREQAFVDAPTQQQEEVPKPDAVVYHGGGARPQLFPDWLKKRIKAYVALGPLHFYTQIRGHDYQLLQGGREARWHGGFCVNLKPLLRRGIDNSQVELVPGHWTNWSRYDASHGDPSKPLHGDAFRFVMLERYHSMDSKQCFLHAAMFVARYVLETYGKDALSKDPQPGVTKAPRSASSSRKEDTTAAGKKKKKRAPKKHRTEADAAAPVELPLMSHEERMYLHAVDLWNRATPLSLQREHVSRPAVEYLLKRGICSPSLIVGNRSFRYHPSAQTWTARNEKIHSAALVVRRVDPLGTDRNAIRGVQLLFLDETSASKLDVPMQRKTYGRNSTTAASECFPPVMQHSFVLIRDYQPEARETAARITYHGATVAVAEGVETAASVAEACPELSVWASLGIGNISNMPRRPQGRDDTILYCADNDERTDQMDQQHQLLITGQGWNAVCCRPEGGDAMGELKGMDFNDMMQRIRPRTDALDRIRQVIIAYAKDAADARSRQQTAIVAPLPAAHLVPCVS